jgi:acyl-CoA dehydrogenase
MSLQLPWSATDDAFRAEVRGFLQAAVPADIRAKVLAHEVLEKEHYVRWQKILSAQGWLGWTWPKEWGGPGWDARQIHIFEEELWLAGAPEVYAFGLRMLAPVLLAHGTEAQKQHHLPRIVSCEDWWCQGYSEPGAGSDLASLRTSARIEGDTLVINGQKTWTTYAHFANWIFCLVRTDPAAKPQQGISFVLVDMATPGITVRPIELVDGECEVNEVFFDEVRVPLANVVGQLNDGWTVAKALLGHERFNVGKIGRSKRELQLLQRIAARPRADGSTLLQDGAFAQHIAQVEVDILALEATVLRLVSAAKKGQGNGAEASVLKLHGTAVAQRITGLLVDALGEDINSTQPLWDSADAPTPAALGLQHLNWRKLTIYGGSDEVQRNIITKVALGL